MNILPRLTTSPYSLEVCYLLPRFLTVISMSLISIPFKMKAFSTMVVSYTQCAAESLFPVL